MNEAALYPHFDYIRVRGLEEARPALVHAALTLFALMGTQPFTVKIPGTTPPVYVVVGAANGIEAELRKLSNG